MSSKINLQPCEYARKSSIFQDNQLISVYIHQSFDIFSTSSLIVYIYLILISLRKNIFLVSYIFCSRIFFKILYLLHNFIKYFRAILRQITVFHQANFYFYYYSYLFIVSSTPVCFNLTFRYFSSTNCFTKRPCHNFSSIGKISKVFFYL